MLLLKVLRWKHKPQINKIKIILAEHLKLKPYNRKQLRFCLRR
jgi:hypothetical protein